MEIDEVIKRDQFTLLENRGANSEMHQVSFGPNGPKQTSCEFRGTVDGQTLQGRQRQMMRNADTNTRNKTGPTLKRPRPRPFIAHSSTAKRFVSVIRANGDAPLEFRCKSAFKISTRDQLCS